MTAEFLPHRPLVGREQALDVLRGALRQAVADQGCLVLVTGEPGIGKTRLAQHLAGEAESMGARALWSSAGPLASAEHCRGMWCYERIEESGHRVPLEAPERLGRLLLDFLAEPDDAWPAARGSGRAGSEAVVT